MPSQVNRRVFARRTPIQPALRTGTRVAAENVAPFLGRGALIRLGLVGVGVGASLLAAAPATAQLRIVTSKGVELNLPAVESLSGDCRRIEQVLGQIDRSNYRTGPSSFDPNDQPLFDYENRLSWLRVHHCGLGNPQKFRQGIGSFTAD